MNLRNRTIAAAALAALAVPAAATPEGGLLAIRVGRAETISQGTLEHAVVLIEGGRIVAVGEDLPVERGIPTLDRPEWVLLPGLVNPHTRLGLDGRGGSDFRPEVHAEVGLLPRRREYDEVLEMGVTTLGLYPAGSGGVPGQAAAVRPAGDTREEMLLESGAYLKFVFRADSKAKKTVREGFEKADEYDEDVQKAVEKYEKALEKYEKDKKKKKSSKDEKDDKDEKKEEGDEEKKDDEGGDAAAEEPSYEPPELDPQAAPFLALRKGELRALFSLGSASDYLHLLDALDDEEIAWDLHVPASRQLDVFHVADRLGEAKRRVLMEPELSYHPNTMRQRNLPAELQRAGAPLVLVPRRDDVEGHRYWLRHVGELVGAGLPRDVALRAVTLEAAEVLGLADRLGSIEKGKDANLVFFDGDPFQPGTRVRAVMLEGRFVHGEMER